MPHPESSIKQDLDADTVFPKPLQLTIASTLRPSPGTCLGDYVIESELARGGMGVIYVAQHRVMQRRVAIKTLCTGLCNHGSERERLMAEAEAAAKLDHVGIVPIFEVGKVQGEPYLVMKLIEGENLAQRLQRGPLSIDDTVSLGIDLANAVQHAHERGVIHRDLKPANILLDAEHEDRPVITDFGIAKLVQSIRQRMTSAGEPIGTPHFMPPEQADQSRGTVGPQADVYSLGAVLYAALTGRPPFQAASAMDVIFQVLTKEPVPPKRLNATVPATLDAIVMKCLEKAPSRRYQSAADLADDLSCFASGKPTMARPMNVIDWTLYQLRRHVFLATVSGSVVTLMMIACFVVALLYLQGQNEVVQLQLQLAEQGDVLATERMLFRSQLSHLQQREVGQNEFDAKRLADYSKYVSESDPTLATRLAVESLKLSLKGALEPSEFCVDWLRSQEATGRGEHNAVDPPVSLDELVDFAERNLASTNQSPVPTPLPWLGIESAGATTTPLDQGASQPSLSETMKTK